MTSDVVEQQLQVLIGKWESRSRPNALLRSPVGLEVSTVARAPRAARI